MSDFVTLSCDIQEILYLWRYSNWQAQIYIHSFYHFALFIYFLIGVNVYSVQSESAPVQLKFYPRFQIYLRIIAERTLSYPIRMDWKRAAEGLFVYIGKMKFVWQVFLSVWTEKQKALPRSVGDSRWAWFAYILCGRHRTSLSVCTSVFSNQRSWWSS